MKKLPKPNPPSADSPLPAGQHYEITRLVDIAIQKPLLTEPIQKQREFLIGLEVQYFVAKEEDGEEMNYAMPFGKVLSTLEETQAGKTALSREFLDKIYAKVDAYVRENVQQSYLVTNVILQVRTNKVLYILSCSCRTIGTSYLGRPVRCSSGRDANGSKRWCCLSGGVYYCSHSGC